MWPIVATIEITIMEAKRYMEKVKNLSIWSYVFLFGALYGSITQPNLNSFWLITALVGGVLMAIKNKFITNPYWKNRILAADILVTLFLIMTTFSPWVPTGIKQLVFLVVVVSYLVFYYKRLFKGKFE